MTTTELLKLVRKKILESTDEIIETDILLAYATQRQQDIFMRVFPNSKILTSPSITLSSGVGALPVTFATLYGDAFDTNNNYYPELSIEDFQRKTLDRACTIEEGQLKVYPITVASVQIKYFPKSSEITLLQDPTIHTYFDKCLVYGTVSDALEDLQDQATSKYYDDRYETELVKRSSILSNFEEMSQDNGQMFKEQNLLGGYPYNGFFL